jgi:hypothetical protein
VAAATPFPSGFFYFYFYFLKNINFNIFLLITVEGILVFKSKLTVKNGIFHPS